MKAQPELGMVLCLVQDVGRSQMLDDLDLLRQPLRRHL
jgi:hypothetical protein